MSTVTEETAVAEVLAAEAERCRASEAGDWEAMGRLLHPDLIYTHTDGKTQNREVYFADVQKKQRPVLRTKLKVNVYGDVAVMSGGLAFGDKTVPDRITLQVWVRNEGRWQMAACESCVLAERRLADHLAG